MTDWIFLYILPVILGLLGTWFMYYMCRDIKRPQVLAMLILNWLPIVGYCILFVAVPIMLFGMSKLDYKDNKVSKWLLSL